MNAMYSHHDCLLPLSPMPINHVNHDSTLATHLIQFVIYRGMLLLTMDVHKLTVPDSYHPALWTSQQRVHTDVVIWPNKGTVVGTEHWKGCIMHQYTTCQGPWVCQTWDQLIHQHLSFCDFLGDFNNIWEQNGKWEQILIEFFWYINAEKWSHKLSY